MIALLVILVLLWPPLQAPPSVPLILVHAPGQAVDATTATQAAREALAWWAVRLGATAPPVGPVERLEVAEPRDYASWLPRRGPGAIYVVMGAETLTTGRRGAARPGLAVAVERPSPGPLAALIAHEWGHAALGLPDIPDASVDIMAGGYRSAYAEGRVGCLSLWSLGRPCATVYLPEVAR